MYHDDILMAGSGRRKSIDCTLYNAAIEGNFDAFNHVQNIEHLLTPNNNSILHLHLTSAITIPTQTVSPPQPLFSLLNKRCERSTVSEDFVKKVLDKCGGQVLIANAKGETPLHLAARYGHSAVTKLLIESAKSFHDDIEAGRRAEKELMRAKSKTGDTALHEAVRHNPIEVVDILLNLDKSINNVANNENETPLYIASERKYKRIVDKILVKVESPAYEGPNDRTALHAAVINSDIGMVKDLMKNEHVRSAIKHADGRKGWIPLHYAVKDGNTDLTTLLLNEDRNTDTAYMQDKEGRTAFHIAAYFGHEEIVDTFVKHYQGCSEIVDNKGWNVLHYAVKGGSSHIVAKIMRKLSLSHLYNEKDIYGDTPLHHLASSRIQSRELVYHNRVDRLALNKNDQTALDVAYAIAEDADRVLTKKRLIMQLEKAGGIGSQHLDERDRLGKGTKKLEFTKEAKESHLIVATLIATVTFAAAFTLPGGTEQDGDHKGSPILGHKPSFKAFIVSNTISLVMAASAAFIHLFSPLNKAKWLDYYFSEVAFSFTLVAIATMIVAFGTGTFAVLGSSPVGIAAIIVGLSFFFVFRQVLQMSFGGESFFTFVMNLVNAIIFPFIRFTPRPFGFFILFFKRSDEPRII
ncbi:hypothetical protein AHAS_Ahas09G0207300 [Arachis hypogaea]